MTKNILYSLIAFSWCLCTLTGCADDLDFRPTEIPEGETEVKFCLSYKDFAPALESRTAGDAIEKIETLWMVIYKSDGTFESKVDVTSKLSHPSRSPEEKETDRVEFTMKMFNGTYRIYAVANMDLANEDVTSEEKLRNLSCEWVKWDKDDSSYIQKNAEMFGYFVNGTTGNATSQDFNAVEVTIDGSHKELHARLFRLASKVTVAFDGSGLADGVNIYIKSLRIRNVPASCALGVSNKPESAEELLYTGKEEYTGEEIQYAPGETFDENYSALITKQNPFFPRKAATDADSNPTWDEDSNPHSAKSPNSLFFYENNQGTGPDKTARKDTDGDGILDDQYLSTNAGSATYIEVEAYYVSDNPKRPGISNITYRFPLGQNVTTDYNARRNCHYKLTLGFKGYANEPDWRIDYVTVLYVSQPNVVDYRGKYFVPNEDFWNEGYDFRDNVITVTSYQYDSDSWKKKEAVDYDIEYREPGSDEFKEFTAEQKPEWLDNFTTTTVENETGVTKLQVKYLNPYKTVKLNDHFNKDTKTDHDLSTNGGTTVMNTANCYIVDAPGTYTFPLVYGNAITNGGEIDSPYTYKGWLGLSDEDKLYYGMFLKKFKNYKGESIHNPYILKDIYKESDKIPTNLEATLVWQDELNLVTNVTYIQSTGEGPGYIGFTVENPKEGNAVIALKDPTGTIMWSWHIWVTPITTLDESITKIKNITLTNHAGNKFEIMPVNLGWCSGGEDLRFYERHECELRITQKISGSNGEHGFSQTVKIVQEPHIALPRGNNPYYQWGRKDPFVAGLVSADNSTMTNKTWYNPNPYTEKPMTIYANENDRKETIAAIADLIKNPDKWHNGPREENPYDKKDVPGDYAPTNVIFYNLWDNSTWDDNNYVIKTIYDPCPPGFHVSSYQTFSGFTNTGTNTTASDIPDWTYNQIPWYGARDTDMLPEYRTGLFEFYTDKSKLISIGFPENGYRDWDDIANLYHPDQGFVWLAQGLLYPWDYIYQNNNNNKRKYLTYYFKYHRNPNDYTGIIVRPYDNYYATDGCPVRPTKSL